MYFWPVSTNIAPVSQTWLSVSLDYAFVKLLTFNLIFKIFRLLLLHFTLIKCIGKNITGVHLNTKQTFYCFFLLL